MKLHRHAPAALLAALGACAALSVMAQESPQQEPPQQAAPVQSDPPVPAEPSATTPTQPTPGTPAQVADDQVKKFAVAYVAVQDIQAKATQQLDTTKDPAQVEKVKTDAETAMIQAVEQSGLKVEEFNQISQAMATDLDLRNRITAEVLQRKGSGS